MKNICSLAYKYKTVKFGTMLLFVLPTSKLPFINKKERKPSQYHVLLSISTTNGTYSNNFHYLGDFLWMECMCVHERQMLGRIDSERNNRWRECQFWIVLILEVKISLFIFVKRMCFGTCCDNSQLTYSNICL